MEDLRSFAEMRILREDEFVRGTDLLVFIKAGIVWIGVLLLCGVLATAVMTALHQSPDAIQKAIPALTKNSVSINVLTAGYYVVLLYFVWRIAQRVAEPSLVARYRPVPLSAVGLGVGAGFLLALSFLVLNAYLIHNNVIHLQPTKSEALMHPASPGELPVAILAVGLIAPFTEELYFRGLLLSWLKQKMPAAAAVVVSAALFALVHFKFAAHAGIGGWYLTAVIASLGVINALVAMRSGSLWAPFGVHAAYNITLVSAPVLAQALKAA